MAFPGQASYSYACADHLLVGLSQFSLCGPACGKLLESSVGAKMQQPDWLLDVTAVL